MDVRGKVVLITGASRGIGEACACAFARRGARLSLASRSQPEILDALTSQVDITLQADRELLVQRTLDRYGRIDILVNNAGTGVYGPTGETGISQILDMFALNVFAPLALIQIVIPHMRNQESGVIVNVSSVAAEITLPWMTLYSASKAALSALSSGLRRELRDSGIQIVDVLPGYVTTDFQNAAIGQPPKGVLSARRRAITPAQCAESIVRGVERGAHRVVAPAWYWPAILAQRLVPSVLDSPLSKMNR